VKKRIILFLGAIGCCVAVYSQGEIDQQQRVFYRNEWSIALMINSNGYGANYRMGHHIDAANKRLYEIDFAYLKDPKEQRTYTHFTNSNARYTEGKKNLAFNFRVGFGKQHEKFRKHDAGGIAIRYFYNFGPSLVLLKPIYYRVARSAQNELEILPPAKYDPWWLSNNTYVMGRSSFFKGFTEIQPVPGAFAKYGYNFDFGVQDRVIHALEVGLIGEIFLRKIEIMDYTNISPVQNKIAQNRQLFLTLYLSYRFGRIVDPYEVRRKRERSREISY